MPSPPSPPDPRALTPESTSAKADGEAGARVPPPPEFGGRDGPDPVRFGDWEKNGRCIDF